MLHFHEEICSLTTQRHTSEKILKEEKLAPIEIQTYTLLNQGVRVSAGK